MWGSARLHARVLAGCYGPRRREKASTGTVIERALSLNVDIKIQASNLSFKSKFNIEAQNLISNHKLEFLASVSILKLKLKIQVSNCCSAFKIEIEALILSLSFKLKIEA